jgi:TetR/AcrR family fatty acid metabolism transcriptional regulator
MPRTPRASAGARDEKRERILAGAVEAFAARGFYRTRVSDVAKAAGVADGTIYLYFSGKDQLLSTIFESTLDDFWSRGRDYVYLSEDAAERVDRLLELHLRYLGENRALAAVFQVDLRHSPHFLGEISRRIFRRHLDRLSDMLRLGQEQGRFATDIEPEVLARLVFGAIDQLVTSWVLSRRNYRLELLIPAAQRFVRRALGRSTGAATGGGGEGD